MNFTYVNPKESEKDLIRFRLGDTVKSRTSLMDEEIEMIIEESSNINTATLKCGEAILAKLSKQVDYTIGPEKVYASQAYDNFRDMLNKLKQRYTSHNIPFAKVGKPNFTIGMHDNVH